MTTRVEGWKSEDVQPMIVTDEMLDEAADEALKDVPVEEANVIKKIWAYDPTSEAAVAFLAGGAREATKWRYNEVDRTVLTCDHVLSDEAIRHLTAAYPEFKWKFTGVMAHSHGQAAVCRKADNRLLLSRIPPGVGFSDIGGNVELLVGEAMEGVHRCGGFEDPHDPARWVKTTMLLRNRLRTGSLSDPQASLARRVLAADEAVVCGKSAQLCDVQTPLTLSCHVYDVPIQDWPLIMERKGARVHEGCMHFSEKFFSEVEGVLAVSGARYIIDLHKDTFSMGFEGAPSHWYTHRWSDYMRYGADQVLYGTKSVFSYKIVERRGDTIFFRILRVPGPVLPETEQYYRLPTVDMVEVDGFALKKPGTRRPTALEPRKYVFPASMWNLMVNSAAVDCERGGLDLNRLVNYYRTIAPRHTINAVGLMGGQRVGFDDVVPLAVHAAIVATCSVLSGQRTARAITEAAMTRRTLDSETTIYKALDAFMGSLVAMGYLVTAPFRYLVGLASASGLEKLKASMVAWAPQSRIKKMDVALLVDGRALGYKYLSSTQPYFEHAARTLPFELLDVAKYNADVANLLAGEFGDVLDPDVRDRLPKPETAAPVSETRLVEPLSGTATVVEVDLPPAAGLSRQPIAGVQFADRDPSVRQQQRLNAVREALAEVQAESRNVLSELERFYREIFALGVPDETLLRTSAERLRNADVWVVEDGYFKRSLLGAEPGSSTHAAAYTATRDAEGLHIRLIQDDDWDATGRRTASPGMRRFADRKFSGYALVNDTTNIFNGPAIETALTAALDVPHMYDVELIAAVAGAGKTYEIMQTVKTDFPKLGGVVVSCPVRLSTDDTRAELTKALGLDRRESRKRVLTVDSYLVNQAGGSLSAGVLLADEAFMAHAGKWYAMAGLLGVQKARFYGDPLQIPHVPRAQVRAMYTTIMPDAATWRYVTYRCPAELVAGWAEVYDYKVRTKVKREGYFKHVETDEGLEVPKGCVMMGMYQADKAIIAQRHSQRLGDIKIMTAHESEGKTFDHVWLYNFEMRNRGPEDSFYLYWKQSYCLVAASRARYGTYYIKRSRQPDLITEWVARATDPRRKAAVQDIETAGKSVIGL